MSDVVIVAIIAAVPSTLSAIVAVVTHQKVRAHDRWERNRVENGHS